MKRRVQTASLMLLAVLVGFGLLLIASRRTALQVEREVLIPTLSSARSYTRIERFGALDPWTSVLPHWTITYSEVPTDTGYDSPSITVNLFCRVSDWRSKGVATMLAEKGYKGSL